MFEKNFWYWCTDGFQTTDVFFIDHRFHRLAQIKSQRLGKIEKLMIDYWFILGTDGHGFEKGTAGCAMGKGLICLKAILKYRHGWLRIGRVEGKLSCDPPTKHTKPWTCEASRNHEVPWDINAEPSRVFLKKNRGFPCLKEKSVIIKKSFGIKEICVNLW